LVLAPAHPRVHSMGVRYRRAKRDGNHTPIVQALRAAGRSVVELHAVGGGVPDLLVGWGQRHMLFMEVKDPKGRNRDEDTQVEFRRRWHGAPVVIVHSVAEALMATGVFMAA
jgi:hypothetical protein